MAEALIQAVLPTKPSTDEINKAAPLRTQVRSAVLKRYQLFQDESPIYTKAGLTYWDLRPMKSFLEAEVAWWNANIELTIQQINTRKISYVETLASLNKDLENVLKTKLSAMKKEKSDEIITNLREVIGKNSAEGFDDVSSAPPASDSSSASPSPSPSPSPSSSIIDLTGATSTVNLANIQTAVVSSPKEIKATTVPKERTWGDDINSAAKYAIGYASTILYLVIALRFASFAANDLLYKPLPYRAIAFVYCFIFMPLLFPYYLYREFQHWFFPEIDAPHFESIFPVIPYEPGGPTSLDQKIYGYGNTPKINLWMDKMRQEQTANRLSAIANTSKVLQALVSAKENP